MNPSLCGFRQFLVVLAEPSATAEQGQCAFHHPSAKQHLEPVAVRAPAHHLQQPPSGGPGPCHQPPGIGCVSPDYLEPGKRPSSLARSSLAKSLLSLPKGLGVDCVNDHGHKQPGGIHYDVALASRHPFTGVIAARPPFSVILTDWLLMMAPLGVAYRPCCSRNMERSASSFHRPPHLSGWSSSEFLYSPSLLCH